MMMYNGAERLEALASKVYDAAGLQREHSGPGFAAAGKKQKT